ncbi:reverse transcriptase domain-containing protein [Tanacetum coccineum]
MIDQGVSAALAARDATRNGTDSHSFGTGVRGSERVARECTYQDFMKCKPLYFKGTEGVVELTQCALTWWNSHVMTVTHEIAYSMTWVDLRKKMTDKYCPRNEMKKLEAELWNLKVIGTDVVKYNQRFQELALLCVRMFPEEADCKPPYLRICVENLNLKLLTTTSFEAWHLEKQRQDICLALALTLHASITQKPLPLHFIP